MRIIFLVLLVSLYTNIGTMEIDQPSVPLSLAPCLPMELFPQICLDLFFTTPCTSNYIGLTDRLSMDVHIDVQMLRINPKAIMNLQHVSHDMYTVVKVFKTITLGRQDILRHILERDNGFYAHEFCTKQLDTLFTYWCNNRYFFTVMQDHDQYYEKLLTYLKAYDQSQTDLALPVELENILPKIMPEYRSKKALSVKKYIKQMLIVCQNSAFLEKLKLHRHFLMPKITENNIATDEVLRLTSQAVKTQPSVVFDDYDVGSTLLHKAALCNATSMLNILLATGVNPNMRESCVKDTPLHFAVFLNAMEAVKLLLAADADPNARNVYKSTSLHGAPAIRNSLDVIDLLCQKKADVNMQDVAGNTPISWAAITNCLDKVKKLLELGADQTIKNCEGLTPLQAARKRGHTQIVQLLQEHN